jgi:hypothetical protein
MCKEMPMTQAIASRARDVHADRSQGQRLRLVPILGPSHQEPQYELLRRETLSSVQITEVSAAGSVPELRVTNSLDVRVFLMDGQELIGAKQNRILNTDVLVPAGGALSIPVSCVEQGRWRQVSPSFTSGKSASHRVRSSKLARVHQSLKTGRKHDAEQVEVWQDVAMSLAASETSSPTGALADAYAQRERELASFRRDLQLPNDAVGLAAFHDGKLQGLDLFDRHATLRYFWESLLDSYAIDFLAAPINPTEPAQSGEAHAVQAALDAAAAARWEPFDSPGEGQDWRLSDPAYAGAALVWEDKVVIHLQLFPRQVMERADAQASDRPRLRRRYGPRE